MAAKRVRGAQRSIHRRNLIYQLIYPYTKALFFHYYGTVEVRGTENIPGNTPVIFAWGFGGQYLFMLPEYDAVVVITNSLANATRALLLT